MSQVYIQYSSNGTKTNTEVAYIYYYGSNFELTEVMNHSVVSQNEIKCVLRCSIYFGRLVHKSTNYGKINI